MLIVSPPVGNEHAILRLNERAEMVMPVKPEFREAMKQDDKRVICVTTDEDMQGSSSNSLLNLDSFVDPVRKQQTLSPNFGIVRFVP